MKKPKSNLTYLNFSNQRKRICIILALIFSHITAGILAWSLHPDYNQNSRQYPLLDPLRDLIAQEHFIINIQPLREDLYRIITDYTDAKIGIYFEFLNTGGNISINQDERFWPASLIKMPTAIAVMKKVELGEWKLSNELVMMLEDRDDRYGQLYKEKVGTTYTIERLLKELLINSDDTAHRILIRNLEAENFIDILDGLGMSELYNENYEITAKEYSRIFRSLYTSSFLQRSSSQQLLTWLSETPFTEWLDKGIPDNVTFSHKIGENDIEKTYLDSGIVYIPNRPYIITVMIDIPQEKDQSYAELIMKEISQSIYEYISTQ